MDVKEILSRCDHTLLKQTATASEIRDLVRDGIKYGVASVCIPPCYVAYAKKYADDLPICTVIGFPNGNSTTASKVFETMDAIRNGADEIDMVINIGFVKSGEWEEVENEIQVIRDACVGKVLKVIIETCLLTREEKIKMCQIISRVGADYIKTSTGFSTGGATLDDVRLFAENVGDWVKIKAAGGIRTLEDAEKYIKAGCSRLGTSAIVNIVKKNESK